MKSDKKKKGFTLVELLIVIAITGILMAVAAPKYSSMIERANNIKNQSYAREIVNYVDMHNAEHPNSTINEDDTLDTIVAKESFKVDDDFTKAKEELSKLKVEKISDIRKLAKDGIIETPPKQP